MVRVNNIACSMGYVSYLYYVYYSIVLNIENSVAVLFIAH